MELILLAAALVLLLALNALFVLAEFAIVKVRPSRVAELIADGNRRATRLADIQNHLDEYLSVCQVGITFASVALGMVGTRATEVVLGAGERQAFRYGLAIAVSYVVVSGSHILLGELVPKSVAIRVADRAALWCAAPLRFSHTLFYPILWVLTRLANATLRMMGMRRPASQEEHSEEELRIILEHSQERGVMSFRRLLFMENVFDFGGLTVRAAMRPRSSVRCLDVRSSPADNLATVKASRFTRYPLIVTEPERPSGFVHIKDLVMHAGEGLDLAKLARPILTTTETVTLESLLSDMQRRRIHVALVNGADGRWTGFITLEDIIEELIGTIRDEFEDEEPVRLSDLIGVDSVKLDVPGDTPLQAVRAALATVSRASLPMPREQIADAIAARERLVGTYIGHGVAMPHARVPGLARPFVMLLRSTAGVRCDGTPERGHLLFVLLTPAGQPRIHQQLQSIIATLLHESEYVRERLMTAATPLEVVEVLRAGEQAVPD